jgi:hypothetical protein
MHDKTITQLTDHRIWVSHSSGYISPPSSWSNKPSKIPVWVQCFHTGLLLGLFNSEDGGEMFPQNVSSLRTGYRLDNWELRVRVLVRSRIFSMSSRPPLGPTQLPIQWAPGVKRPGHGVDHSPPTSAEVKKTWIYTSTLPLVFMVMFLIN